MSDMQAIYNERYGEQAASQIEEAKQKARTFGSQCMKHVSITQKFNSILDLGCGNGTKTYWLKDHANTVLGVDISETGIAQAREFCGREGIEYQVADVGKDGLGQRYPCITSFGLSTTNLERVEDVVPLIMRYIRCYGESETTYVYFSKTDFTGRNPGWKYYSHSELKRFLKLLSKTPEVYRTQTIFFLPKNLELNYKNPLHFLALHLFQMLSWLRHRRAYRLPFIIVIKARLNQITA
jgi:SAM-dependent methyltransferase